MANKEETKTSTALIKLGVVMVILIGVPVYLSTDSFLTWLYQKAKTDKWEDPAGVQYKVANYMRWTFRTARAAELYEDFANTYANDQKVLEMYYESVYWCAVCNREEANAIEYKAKGDPVLREQRTGMLEKAQTWFQYYADNYATGPRAEVCRRAAQAIRDGY